MICSLCKRINLKINEIIDKIQILLFSSFRRSEKKKFTIMPEAISIETSTVRENRISFFEYRNKIIGKNYKILKKRFRK